MYQLNNEPDHRQNEILSGCLLVCLFTMSIPMCGSMLTCQPKKRIKREISQTRYGLRATLCMRPRLNSQCIPNSIAAIRVGPSCSTTTSQRIFKIVVYRKRHTFVLVLCFLAFYLDFVSFYQTIQWNVQNKFDS